MKIRKITAIAGAAAMLGLAWVRAGHPGAVQLATHRPAHRLRS